MLVIIPHVHLAAVHGRHPTDSLRSKAWEYALTVKEGIDNRLGEWRFHSPKGVVEVEVVPVPLLKYFGLGYMEHEFATVHESIIPGAKDRGAKDAWAAPVSLSP